MTSEFPRNYKLAFDKAQIEKRLSVLGQSVNEWANSFKNADDQLLSVCVLRGGSIFYTDLIRNISSSVEMAFCRTWSYSVENHQIADGSVRVSVETVAAHARRVLIVDDICDTGHTLKKLQNVFLELGAIEVRSAVLIHRKIEASVFSPTWSAFEYKGDEWFVGYGMMDKERFGNLPEVYSIRK